MQVVFNDRLGSRSIVHMNMLVAPVGDQTVIFEFAGKNVPGAATITSVAAEKNGKWSFTAWTVDLATNVQSFVWTQDWETSQYLNSGTWANAIEDVRRLASMPDLDAAAIERFIRARLPNKAKALDSAETAKAADPTPILLDLIAAQAELATARAAEAAVQQEIASIEAAQLARKEAAETRDRVAKAKAAMSKGASLADLKAMLAA